MMLHFFFYFKYMNMKSKGNNKKNTQHQHNNIQFKYIIEFIEKVMMMKIVNGINRGALNNIYGKIFIQIKSLCQNKQTNIQYI